MSSSKPTTASVPVVPVPQVVAPVAAPVAPMHVVKKHKRKHVNHGAQATTTKVDAVPTTESANAEADTPSR
jgi:hypothetical protein